MLLPLDLIFRIEAFRVRLRWRRDASGGRWLEIRKDYGMIILAVHAILLVNEVERSTRGAC